MTRWVVGAECALTVALWAYVMRVPDEYRVLSPTLDE
jgi:hypothetical protein